MRSDRHLLTAFNTIIFIFRVGIKTILTYTPSIPLHTTQRNTALAKITTAGKIVMSILVNNRHQKGLKWFIYYSKTSLYGALIYQACCFLPKFNIYHLLNPFSTTQEPRPKEHPKALVLHHRPLDEVWGVFCSRVRGCFWLLQTLILWRSTAQY